jgi:hypothetical protein
VSSVIARRFRDLSWTLGPQRLKPGFFRRDGTTEEAAGKLFEGVRSSPQALKRLHIFNSLAARLEVVPFPFPGESDFFRSL